MRCYVCMIVAIWIYSGCKNLHSKRRCFLSECMSAKAPPLGSDMHARSNVYDSIECEGKPPPFRKAPPAAVMNARLVEGEISSRSEKTMKAPPLLVDARPSDLMPPPKRTTASSSSEHSPKGELIITTSASNPASSALLLLAGALRGCSDQVNAFHTLHEEEQARRNKDEARQKEDYIKLFSFIEELRTENKRLSAREKTLTEDVSHLSALAATTTAASQWATATVEGMAKSAVEVSSVAIGAVQRELSDTRDDLASQCAINRTDIATIGSDLSRALRACETRASRLDIARLKEQLVAVENLCAVQGGWIRDLCKGEAPVEVPVADLLSLYPEELASASERTIDAEVPRMQGTEDASPDLAEKSLQAEEDAIQESSFTPNNFCVHDCEAASPDLESVVLEWERQAEAVLLSYSAGETRHPCAALACPFAALVQSYDSVSVVNQDGTMPTETPEERVVQVEMQGEPAAEVEPGEENMFEGFGNPGALITAEDIAKAERIETLANRAAEATLESAPTGSSGHRNVHERRGPIEDDTCSLAGTVLNDASDDTATIVDIRVLNNLPAHWARDSARKGSGQEEKDGQNAQSVPGPWDDMTDCSNTAWKNWQPSKSKQERPLPKMHAKPGELVVRVWSEYSHEPPINMPKYGKQWWLNMPKEVKPPIPTCIEDKYSAMYVHATAYSLLESERRHERSARIISQTVTAEALRPKDPANREVHGRITATWAQLRATESYFDALMRRVQRFPQYKRFEDIPTVLEAQQQLAGTFCTRQVYPFTEPPSDRSVYEDYYRDNNMVGSKVDLKLQECIATSEPTFLEAECTLIRDEISKARAEYQEDFDTSSKDVRATAKFEVANKQISSLESFALLLTLVFNVPGSLALLAWQSGWSKPPNTGVGEDHALTQLLELGPQIYHSEDWKYAMCMFEGKHGAFFQDGPHTAWQNHGVKRFLASQGLVVFPCMRDGCDKPSEDGFPSTEGDEKCPEDLHFCGTACAEAFLTDPRRLRRGK